MLRDSHFSWPGNFLNHLPTCKAYKIQLLACRSHCLLLKLSSRFIGIREASRALKCRIHASTDSARWHDTVPVSQYYSQARKCKIDDHCSFTEIYYQTNYKSFTEIPADIWEPWYSNEPMIHGNRRDRLSPYTFTVSIKVAKYMYRVGQK